MSDQERNTLAPEAEDTVPELQERRNFLLGLGKWSKAVMGAVALGGLLNPGREAEAWGGSSRDSGHGIWVNFRSDGGWGRDWHNRPGGWYNRPHSWEPEWSNRPWYNRPRWYNGSRWHNHGGWRHRDDGWGGNWFNR